MSGDQIYADEVGHPLMPRVLRVAKDLIGVDEADVFGAPPPIGGRGPGTRALGYTGATANHLWSYGEFMAMYLLAWSPVLWPAALPEFPTNPPLVPDVDPDVSEESWDEDRLNVGLFQSALPQVRRVLANVPSLMIFDDHEITDDWNIDLPWVNTVYASTNKAGRRAVTNGLLAYLLCQHWGNRPAAFTTAGSPEQRALAAVSSAVSAATPRSAAETCAPLLGLPADKLPTAPPAQVLRDLSAAGAIRYDHALGPDDGWPVRIVLMDERTVREYPRTDSRGARISRAALAVQLPPPPTPVPFTVIVAAAPILGSDLVENVLQPLFQLIQPDTGARFADYESWSGVTANHQDLLARIAAHHPAVLLSGDVHYGFTSRLTRTEGGVTTRAAQLTASAAKNLETKNTAISMFSELAMRLGLERVRETSGFAQLSNADKTKLLSAPAAGSTLAWDDARDVLLGRVARDGVSKPAAIPTPVAEAYGLAAPGWTYTVEPVDDPMHDVRRAGGRRAVAGMGSGQVAEHDRRAAGRRPRAPRADVRRARAVRRDLVQARRLVADGDPGAALPGRQCRAERRAPRAPLRGRADVSGIPPVPLFGPVTLNTSEALREAKGGLVKSAPYLAAGIALANADEILEIVEDLLADAAAHADGDEPAGVLQRAARVGTRPRAPRRGDPLAGRRRRRRPRADARDRDPADQVRAACVDAEPRRRDRRQPARRRALRLREAARLHARDARPRRRELLGRAVRRRRRQQPDAGAARGDC